MALASELERVGYTIDYGVEYFRVAAIPRGIERLFSKRRQAIEAAAKARGYRTAKSMELAALKTRKAKRAAPREALFEMWRADARALGYELKRQTVDAAGADKAASRCSARSRLEALSPRSPRKSEREIGARRN
jgi:hypothetical protein